MLNDWVFAGHHSLFAHVFVYINTSVFLRDVWNAILKKITWNLTDLNEGFQKSLVLVLYNCHYYKIYKSSLLLKHEPVIYKVSFITCLHSWKKRNLFDFFFRPSRCSLPKLFCIQNVVINNSTAKREKETKKKKGMSLCSVCSSGSVYIFASYEKKTC